MDPLPLPANTIQHMNKLAHRNPKSLIFSDRSGNPLTSQDDDNADGIEDTDFSDVPSPQQRNDNNDDEDNDDDNSSYSPSEHEDNNDKILNTTTTG
eukprot:12558350-Ditylum_brightwellii.AAC.1